MQGLSMDECMHLWALSCVMVKNPQLGGLFHGWKMGIHRCGHKCKLSIFHKKGALPIQEKEERPS